MKFKRNKQQSWVLALSCAHTNRISQIRHPSEVLAPTPNLECPGSFLEQKSLLWPCSISFVWYFNSLSLTEMRQQEESPGSGPIPESVRILLAFVYRAGGQFAKCWQAKFVSHGKYGFLSLRVSSKAWAYEIKQNRRSQEYCPRLSLTSEMKTDNLQGRKTSLNGAGGTSTWAWTTFQRVMWSLGDGLVYLMHQMYAVEELSEQEQRFSLVP